MKSTIKMLFVLILSCNLAYAQQDEVAENKVGAEHENLIRMIFDAGINRNFSSGNNFLNEAHDLKYGWEAGMNFLVLEKFLVGARYESFSASVENPDVLGNYNRTTIRNIQGNIGYQLRLSPEWDVTGLAGLGWGSYANQVRRGVRFYDHAMVFSAQVMLGYNLSNNFGFYLAAKARHDDMRIRTAPELQDYFDSTNIYSLSLGIRFKTN